MDTRRSDIAMFFSGFSDGGAERVIVNLTKGFSRVGRSVDIVLARSDPPGNPYMEEASSYGRLVDLNAGRTIRAIFPLMDYLKSEQPAALISHMTHCNVVALMAVKLARMSIPTAVVEHNVMSEKRREAPAMRGRVVYRLAKRLYPWADSIVGVSHGVTDDLALFLRLPRHDMTVIYNPIVTPEIIDKAREPLDHDWFRPDGPPVILGVGRLCEQKDFPTLLKAFEIVRSRRPAKLVVLGEGEDRLKLEALAQKLDVAGDTSFLGFVGNPFSFMSRASVFVLSSSHEGLPSVLIEALACGTPVVSTDCPSGPSEILDRGAHGKLVPVGHAEALARAILETLDQPPEKQALRDSVKRFSDKDIAETYLRELCL